MKRLVRYLASDWQTATIVSLSLIAVFTLLWFGLDSLTPGFSAEEISYRASHGNLRQIADNPVNVIHGLPTAILQMSGKQGPMAMRTVSALIGLLIAVTFYLVLRSWLTERIAILGTLLAISSPWFLHSARLATADIVYATIIGIVLLGVWLVKGKWPAFTLFGLAVVGSLLLYTPGFLWIIAPGLIWQRKRVIRALNSMSFLYRAAWFICTGLLVAPLLRALWLRPELLRTILGLSDHSIIMKDTFRRLLDIPVQLVYRGPDNPVVWLDTLPLLNIFVITMVILGSYACWYRIGLDRTRLLIGLFLIGALLVAIGGIIPMLVLLPVIYIVAASGIALMLQQWFTVFPRNPLARSIAATLIVLAVALNVFYNFNHYFIAWPNAPETKAVFQHRP